jgi:hypothetical protein
MGEKEVYTHVLYIFVFISNATRLGNKKLCCVPGVGLSVRAGVCGVTEHTRTEASGMTCCGRCELGWRALW